MNANLPRLAALLLLAAPFRAQAVVEAPDHVLYGNVTVFGAPATYGTVIELRRQSDGRVVTSYVLGRDVQLGNQFALRIPMDSVDPRRDGYARPGDPVRVFVGGQVAAETTVGAEGVAVRLDLDPQNMGTGPAVTVADRSQLEGDAGQVAMLFPVQLNTTSNVPVQVEWQTAAGSATGGVACTAGVDFVQDQGMLSIPAGSLQGTFQVLLCGDTAVEPDEVFSVALTRVVNGVAARNSVAATVLDDDNIPTLSVPDARGLEPTGGSAPLTFRPRLSRTSAAAVSFSYVTLDGSAQAGTDYVASSGVATIPAGQLEIVLTVPMLADAQVESDESFRLVLGAPQLVRLPTTMPQGTITDPAFDPAVAPVQAIEGGPEGVASLLNPSAVELSPDGNFLYATSEQGDAVLQFARSPGGVLVPLATYQLTTPGFNGAKLDGAKDLEISADGAFLYVAARASDGISVLARDPLSGNLSFVHQQGNNEADPQASGGTVRGLGGVSALALSPDGAHLYASAATGNAIAVFARDAVTGRLRYLEAESNGLNDAADPGPAVAALDRPGGLVLSANGAQLYVAARFGNAVLRFDRNTTAASADFGKLSYVGNHVDGLLGVQGLAGASSLALSPDGAQLYAVGEQDDALVRFDRAADGSLSWNQQWVKGSAGLPGMDGPQAIEMAPNGEQVFVTGFVDHSLTVFTRTPAGALTPRQTVFDDEGTVQDLGGPTAMASSSDDRHLYVAASTDNAILVFRRLGYGGDDIQIFGNGFED